MSLNARIAIAYHTGRGHTGRQAEAVARGAASVFGASSQLHLVDGNFTNWAELQSSDAIIFGAPTYMGGPSSAFKAFQEATSNAVYAKGCTWQNKVAAGFTNSASRSGDKLATLIQLAVFAAQHRMLWVPLGLPPGNNSSKGSESDLNRLGFFLGAAAQSNADQSADVVPPDADLETAACLGKRVAEITLQLLKGAATK